MLPAQGTLARFISALLMGGVSITGPKTHRSVARIKKLGAISTITSPTAIITGNLTRRVAMVGPPHSSARKLAEKITLLTSEIARH